MDAVLSLPRRLKLQKRLEETSGLPEPRVHFQPPTGTEMVYPAVVYSLGRADVQFADNLPYRSAQAYSVAVISKDPDEPIREEIAALPYCAFDRWYATDGLNHFVYTIFF